MIISEHKKVSLFLLDMMNVVKGTSRFGKIPNLPQVSLPVRNFNDDAAGAINKAGGAFGKKGVAEESAYFYNLQKEQLDKLKGLREKSSKKVKFEILKPSDLLMVQKLMYKSGYPREPMIKHLRLCKGLYSIPDNDKMIEKLIIEHNMSLLAKDKETQKPLGLVINGEFSREDISPFREHVVDMITHLRDPAFGPIMAIRREINNMGGNILFQEINSDVIFDTKFLMVKPYVSMRGLGTGLLSRAVQQASVLGYDAIKTVVTHDALKRAARDNGMDMIAEIEFDEFLFAGKKVFEGIPKHSSISFFAKKLH